MIFKVPSNPNYSMILWFCELRAAGGAQLRPGTACVRGKLGLCQGRSCSTQVSSSVGKAK